MAFQLPPLYPILDSSLFPSDRVKRDAWLHDTVAELHEAGATLLQLRVKQGSDGEVLRDAEAMRCAASSGMTLILNDRVHLLRETGFAGVHLGQADMPVDEARALVGPDAILGVSTHSREQAAAAIGTSADYIATGPVFATSSKPDAEPVIGLEGVSVVRAVTQVPSPRPLVAIGGIALGNVASVWKAGADSVAVIGAVFGQADRPGRIVRDFLGKFRYNNM